MESNKEGGRTKNSLSTECHRLDDIASRSDPRVKENGKLSCSLGFLDPLRLADKLQGQKGWNGSIYLTSA